MTTTWNHLTSIAVLVLMIPASVLAQTSAPRLLPPPDRDFRSPSDPIVVEFPYDVISNVKSQLALEVDAIDVSSLVSIDGQLVIYRSLSPFEPGMHQLRLVEYADNGDIVEIGNWTFEIRKSSAFQQQLVEFAATVNNSYIVADDYSGDEPEIDKHHANGAAQIRYSAKDNHRAVHFEGDLIYESDELNSATDNTLDLGHYLLSVDVDQNTRFNVGHHALQHSSLIYNDFNRRGLSGHFALPRLNSEVQVLGSHSGDVQGFAEGLGVADADNRISGLVVNIKPISSNPDTLTLSASYMNGAQANRKDDLEALSGSAQSFAIDSYLVDKRLRFYLETAASTLQFDDNDVVADDLQDNAYQLLGQYSGEPLGSDPNPWLWRVSIEKAYVEPNFFSLSNQNLVSDNDSTLLSATLSKGRWQTHLSYQVAKDNLDERFEATHTTELAGLDVSFAGSSPDTTTALESYNLRTSIQQTWHTQQGFELDTSSTLLPIDDNQTQFIELSADLNYPWGSWYVLLNQNRLNDDSNQQADSMTKGTEWGIDVGISERHNLFTSISRYDTRENDSPYVNETVITSLGMDSSFDQLLVTSSITLDYEQVLEIESSTESYDSDQLSVNASVSRQFSQPKGARPGIDLQLRTTYFDFDSHSPLQDDSDFYEIFAELNIYWSGSR